MKNKEKQLDQYLTEKHTLYEKSCNENTSFLIHLSSAGRINAYNINILLLENALQATVDLPIRVNRIESSKVVAEIMEINDELDDNECFECDLIDNRIRYRLIYKYPEEFEKGVDILISHIKGIIDDYAEQLLRLVSRVSIEIENELARIAAEKAEAERKPRRFWDTVLNMVGLVNKTNSDFDDY